VDLLADFLVPGIPATKLALIEEDPDASRAQCRADFLRSLPIL
jgi:hypothetical protein